jgi:hypothetical protein
MICVIRGALFDEMPVARYAALTLSTATVGMAVVANNACFRKVVVSSRSVVLTIIKPSISPSAAAASIPVRAAHLRPRCTATCNPQQRSSFVALAMIDAPDW